MRTRKPRPEGGQFGFEALHLEQPGLGRLDLPGLLQPHALELARGDLSFEGTGLGFEI